MTSLKRDSNGVAPMRGVLNTDGATPTAITADPITHGMSVSDGTTGAVTSSADARRDDNSVPLMMAVSTDGTTRVALAVDSSGKLLIQTT